jgi:DNA-binding PucR family transcriptional regulator
MLYRVEKFSELTGLDLGSWSVRLRLMIGFIILDLYPELLEEE